MGNGDFNGKLVLVTGGAKNVGKSIARKFAERGAHVIINFFHSLDASKQTVAELRSLGAQVDAIRASVAQKHQVDRMFDEIEARFGRLDILVNNAASGALLGIDDISEEHFDRAIDTNLKGAFWCSRRAAALMQRSGGGAIVNVSSMGSMLVPANYLVVGTSKAALEALARYLAVEYAPHNIRVNTAATTLIDGDVAALFPDSENTKRSSIRATPLKGLATEDDMADLVIFLASPQARWVTGQTILADGGLSLCSEALSPRPQWQSAAPPPVAQIPAAAPVAPEIPDTDDIAIVGMGIALPGANTPEAFWNNLIKGPELFGNVPPNRWDYRSFFSSDPAAQDKSYQSHSVYMTDFEPIERLKKEIDAGTAPEEFTTLWLRHALMQALEGVRLRAEDRTSFLVGYTADGCQHLEEAMVMAGAKAHLQEVLANSDLSSEEREQCQIEFESILKARYARSAEGLAEFFPHHTGLNAMKGVLPDNAEYMMVDTACSSSLYSIDLGIKSLLLSKHDVVAAGGSFALTPRASVLFSKLHGLSKSGEVRPLDKDCDGVLFADGAGVVILKKLKRALADGDKILGILKAFGSSSDGKGKAIYAPNTDGQNIAIRRALDQPGANLEHIDWVIAHATGTPAGDLAEFQSLRSMIGSKRRVHVTSNKSLIGHTGWTAGVASLIQVLLALRHQLIPPQHRFTEPPQAFEIETSSICIPTQAVEWLPKSDAPRVAAVSGFGFGGTNGHLVVSEYRPDLGVVPQSERLSNEPLVVVGWSAKFPGIDTSEALRDWLLGQGKAPEQSFGINYPLPPFERLRMPPGVLRVLDRCQLMAVDAAHDLHDQLRPFWDAHAEKIGIVMGHMGPTRNAAVYASRCYLDDIDGAIRAKSLLTPQNVMHHALAGLRKITQSMVPPTTENSFPGIMPNVIPARVANYFDLHGLNMTVDAGHASTLAAFDAAARYLRCNELDMVIVGGANGNIAAEIKPAFEAAPAEGLVLFAVTTQARAQAAGLPILAVVDSLDTLALTAESAPKATWRGHDGAPATYLGADSALAVLHAIVAGEQGKEICAGNDGDRSRFRLRVDSKMPKPAIKASPQPFQVPLPPDILRTDVCATGEALGLKRYRIELMDTPWEAAGLQALPFLPAQCVVITDAPHLLEQLAPLPADLVVLSAKLLAAVRPGWHHIDAATNALPENTLPSGIRHVRLLTSLHASALPQGELAAPAPQLLALHNLAFLALKHSYENLGQGGSFVALLLDSLAIENLHPHAGLFSGLVKAISIELPTCRSLAVFSDKTDARQAVAQAEHESGGRQLLPVVALRGERRLTPRVAEAAGELPSDQLAHIGPNSVIVAFGGARGITAELMKSIARHFRPTLYLIGSSQIEPQSTALLEGSDEELPRSRPQYIREQRALHPTKPLPQINKEFDRLIDAREARRNIETMREYCGADRVHYLRADVLDASGLKAAVQSVLARDSQIDLVVNAPGLNCSALLPAKSYKDFVAIRDIKVRGYWNMRAAFGKRQPKTWCNFGSVIGITGQSGETDYASGNDFLNSNAAYHSGVLGQDEFTIGWSLWKSVGLGANPVTRAFMEKSGFFTSMSTEEGVHHFLREINLVQRDAVSVHLGIPERQAIQAHFPGFLDLPCKAAGNKAENVGTFYLGKELQRTDRSVVFERIFDLQTDAYLQHHVVNGFATLPGTFLPEIAAEVALQLEPGSKVVGFEDAVFHHFLRVYDVRRPSPKKIHAELLRREGEFTLMQVRVTGDVLAPGRQVLVRDKLHFEIKVLLAPQYAHAPVWPRWPEHPCTPVADPYHFDAAPVRLTDMFVSTTDTCSTPFGKRARYRLNASADDPVFSRFVIPSIMLDGLARVAVLNHVAENYIPLVAPASIRRIDIYEAGNDYALANRYDDITLYAIPVEFALEGENRRNRFVAARPDGRMLMQMKDVTGVVIGYVHRHTGAFVAKGEVNALLPPDLYVQKVTV